MAILEDKEILDLFIEESKEHLSELESSLLSLEKDLDNIDKELIDLIFRAVHSIKGSANFFGFTKINKLSHSMENVFSLIRDSKLKISKDMIDVFLTVNDILKEMIEDVEISNDIDIEKEISQLDKMLAIEPKNKIKSVEKKEEKLKNNFEHNNILSKFSITKEEILSYISEGKRLYTINVFLNKDIKEKNMSPLDYIKYAEDIGVFIDSYSNIDNLNGLEDCLDSEIEFIYFFATVLDDDLLTDVFDIPSEQIKKLDIEKFQNEINSEFKKIENELKNDKHGSKETKIENNIIKTVNNKLEEEKNIIKEDIIKEKIEDIPKEKNIIPKKKKILEQDKKIKKISKIKKETKVFDETLRVNINILNDLMDLAGELVLGRNQLIRTYDSLNINNEDLNLVIQKLDLVTSEIQEKIMNTRMQPVSTVFSKFPRLIRKVSNDMNKDISLEIYGGNVELDKNIIELLSDPLTHLIRNSADHGIETLEERKIAGKSEVAKIILNAYHEFGMVNIDIIDDGKGIDLNSILDKAISKNIIDIKESQNLSEKEILNLIFLPGFSTSNNITNISGRGVGMDVVKTNIEHLGGSVSITSVLGEGTTVNLKIPLTLAIIPSFIIKVLDNKFAVPQINIAEILRINKKELSQIENLSGSIVIRRRGKLLPLLWLSEILELDDKKRESFYNILYNKTNSDIYEDFSFIRIVVIKINDNNIGLIVDEIENSEEVVVKPLPSYLKKTTMVYSGATILGDGNVALILDAIGIIRKAEVEFNEVDKNNELIELKNRQMREKQTLLLTRNSSEEVIAFVLSLVTRVEKVKVSDIEKIGNKEYLQYNKRSIKLIRLNDHLSVSSISNDNEFVFIIFPKGKEDNFAIIVNEIVDVITIELYIDASTEIDGIVGSFIHNDHITLLLDIYRLFEIVEPTKVNNYSTKPSDILIVEDTPFYRILEKQYIEAVGHNVDIAEDGLEAIKKMSKKSYDLIISDICMPNMDGFELIKKIRSNDNFSNIPVIALTSLESKEDNKKAFDLGFTEYENKVNKESLIYKINKILG